MEAEDERASESDDLYESSEPEKEAWQDEEASDQDWAVKVVGVEVVKGEEIHYEARWPAWSRPDGTTNTYHLKGDPASPLTGLTGDWDDARKDRINSVLQEFQDDKDGTAGTVLEIDIWADNDVMSSNTRYHAQLFDEKLAITEGRFKRKQKRKVEYDLGKTLEAEMLRLLTKEIGEKDAKKMLKEYIDEEELGDDDENSTVNGDGDGDDDQEEGNSRRRTRSETRSSRTRSTAPSTSSKTSISRAPSAVSSGPSRSQPNTLSDIQSIPRIPRAQGHARQGIQQQGKQSGKSSALIPPARSAFSSPPPSSFGPQASQKIPTAFSAQFSSAISLSASVESTLPTGLASLRSSAAASKTPPLSLSPFSTPDSASTAWARTTAAPKIISASPHTSNLKVPTVSPLSIPPASFSFSSSSMSKPLSAASSTSTASFSSAMSTSSTSTLVISASTLSFPSPENKSGLLDLDMLSLPESRTIKAQIRSTIVESTTSTLNYTSNLDSILHSSAQPESTTSNPKCTSSRSSARTQTKSTTPNGRATMTPEQGSRSKLRTFANLKHVSQDDDTGTKKKPLAQVKSKKTGIGKGKAKETRSRLQLLSLAWTEAAAQAGAAAVTFVNEVDDEDGPPGVGLGSDTTVGEFRYLEAELETHLEELLDPPDAEMFLRCNCGVGEEDVHEDIDIEMLFEGFESNEKDESSSRNTALEKTCSDSSACGCQGISELLTENARVPVSAYTEEGLFRFASRSNPLESGIEIIECNRYCKCTLYECRNRVAQRPRSVPMEVFKTEIEMQSGSDEDEDGKESKKSSGRGWGVRCGEQAVKRGTVLGCYTGEIIHRQTANELQGDHGTYVFDLDGRDPAEGDEVDPNFQIYSIDARRCGNWTRFLNHSCLPNLAVYTAVWDTIPEQNIPHLVFFALDNIPKGTEMTVDYHAGMPLPKKGRARKKRPPGTHECFCGAKRCRGWV
ncbi:hypothetical protein J3R30DRAFT_3523249 [Lentinula aciculospora]|uniref:SET domain-containing protein n=1 Tax=Lentinula aciculospora TaxID=153920 RepID=A0A9W9A3H3_9AGAR|nr:hypothetical protein J3R30DRAFT_3523249 [Lentinula aciculospora]